MALFTKKTWKDRKSEYPTRRKLTKENGTTELVTVARSEGSISQEGDAFSASNMNDLENRISKAIGTGDIPTELGTDIISALNELNTGINNMSLVKSPSGDIDTLYVYKSAEYITNGEGDKIYKTIFGGYIGTQEYIPANVELYLGYVFNPYPKVVGSLPIIIPALLIDTEKTVTQSACVYIKCNGGIYLSSPQQLKSTKFTYICIPICEQYCYYH